MHEGSEGSAIVQTMVEQGSEVGQKGTGVVEQTLVHVVDVITLQQKASKISKLRVIDARQHRTHQLSHTSVIAYRFHVMQH